MKRENDIFWQNFVYNIVWLRKHHNFSEERMAEIMEIDVELLREVEQGDGADILSVDVVYKIYEYFDIAPNKLFGENLNIEF